MKRFAADGAVAPFGACASPMATSRASPASAASIASRGESNCVHASSPHGRPLPRRPTASWRPTRTTLTTALADVAGAGGATLW